MCSVIIIFMMTFLLIETRINKRLILFLFMLLLIVMMVFTTNNCDYSVYKGVYEGTSNRFTDANGFMLLIDIFNNIFHLNYSCFRLSISLFAALVFWKWFKYEENVLYAIFTYFSFVAFYDVIQIRFALACFFLYLGVLFIIYGKKFVALCCLTMAILVHSTMILPTFIIIYILLTARRSEGFFDKKEIVFIICVIAVFTIGGNIWILLARYLVRYAGENWIGVFVLKLNNYIRPAIAIKSTSIWLVSYGIQLVVLWKYGVSEMLNGEIHLVPYDKVRAVNFLFRLIAWGSVLIPLTLYVEESGRMFRPFFLLIAFIYSLIRNEIEVKNRRVILGMIVLVNLGLMFGWIYRGVNPDMWWSFV